MLIVMGLYFQGLSTNEYRSMMYPPDNDAAAYVHLMFIYCSFQNEYHT